MSFLIALFLSSPGNDVSFLLLIEFIRSLSVKPRSLHKFSLYALIFVIAFYFMLRKGQSNSFGIIRPEGDLWLKL